MIQAPSCRRYRGVEEDISRSFTGLVLVLTGELETSHAGLVMSHLVMWPLWHWRQHPGINHEGALWRWIHLSKVFSWSCELKVDVQPSGVVYVCLTWCKNKIFLLELEQQSVGFFFSERERCDLTARRRGRATVSADGSKWINKWSMNELQTLSHVCTNTSVYDGTDRCSTAAHPQTEGTPQRPSRESSGQKALM